MKLFDGIDSTFEFEALGKAKFYDLDESYPARLEVNPSGGANYVEEGRRGLICHGLYDQNDFRFQLHIPANAVRDIIEKTVFFEKSFTSLESSETENEGYLNMRLFVFFDDEIRVHGKKRTIYCKIDSLSM